MRIANILHSSSCRYPSKVALRQADGKSATFMQLELGARFVASKLTGGYALEPGSHVALLCENSIAVIEAMIGANIAGMVTDYYNMRWSVDAIKRTISEYKPSLLIASRAEDVRALSGAVDVEVVHIDDFVDGIPSSIEDDEPALPCSWDDASMADDAEAIDFFTSGTTGVPKCVMHSNKSIVMEVLNSNRSMSWLPTDVMITSFPLYHSGGLATLTSILSGATTILTPATKAEGLCALIKEHQATRISVVPLLLQRICDYAESEGLEGFDHLRVISYASSKLSGELIARAQALFGCQFIQAYGMTETASSIVSLNSSVDDLEGDLLLAAGKPMFGTQLRVVDDRGDDCPPGMEGEVLIKSDTMMMGYKGRDDLTAKVLDGGWYHSGDSGKFDENGYLYILGRKDDMIISGGENIFPAEVEDCIAGLVRDVEAVSVVGVPDAKFGQTPAAFIVLKPGSALTVDTVRDRCASHLGRFKRPKYVYFVEKLPRNALGKVIKGEMAAMHQEFLKE